MKGGTGCRIGVDRRAVRRASVAHAVAAVVLTLERAVVAGDAGVQPAEPSRFTSGPPRCDRVPLAPRPRRAGGSPGCASVGGGRARPGEPTRANWSRSTGRRAPAPAPQRCQLVQAAVLAVPIPFAAGLAARRAVEPDSAITRSSCALFASSGCRGPSRRRRRRRPAAHRPGVGLDDVDDAGQQTQRAVVAGLGRELGGPTEAGGGGVIVAGGSGGEAGGDRRASSAWPV